MKTKAMKDQATTGLVPKLRFPEFRNEEAWQTKPLNELLYEPKKRNRDLELGPEDVLSVSGEYGCVNQIEFMGRSYAGASVKDYHVVDHGDVVYTKSPLKKNPFGIIKVNKGQQGIVSTLYAVYRPFPNCSGTYLDHFFSGDYNLNAYLQPLVKKGAKNDMKVNNTDVLKGNVCVPKLPEQRKISDCLDSLDELIAAQGRKVEALKTHKKGLMQQLFPREGETQPRLRFPEFQETADWATEPFGEAFDTTSGGTPSRSNSEYWNGDIPWVTTTQVDFGVITAAEEFISKSGLKNSSAKVFPKGTVLIAMYGQGKTRGQVAMLGIEAATNQACAAVLPSREVDPRFVFFNLSARYEELRSLSNSGGQENLSQGLIRDLPFSYPEAAAEQQRIADFLASVDTLITAATQTLDSLKTHKQGLMQQLFPSAEAA